MVADVRKARRYMMAMGAMVAALLAVVPVMNIAVDPLGYARMAGWRPANPNETELAFAASGAWPVPHGTREAKILNVRYYAPMAVYFGSSTVWSYVDTRYAPVRTADGRTAYNFGLPGVSAREMLAAFEHVVALKPPTRVVVGLEFYMFSADKPSSPGYFDLPFAQRPTYRRDLRRFVGQRLFTADHTYQSAAMLWKLLLQRLSTWFEIDLQAAGNGGAPSASRLAFSRLMLDTDKIMASSLYPPPGRPFRFVDDDGWSSLEAFRRMVEIARSNNIDLRFYISPHHARAFEAIRLMGWWPEFESWQRQLASILSADAKAHPGLTPIPLWDFCCYNSVTADPIVEPPGQPAGFRYFADTIHFKTEVGFMIMDRMFATEAARKLPPDFGVPVTAFDVEKHLADIRRARHEYAAANRADIDAVAKVLEALGRLKRLAD